MNNKTKKLLKIIEPEISHPSNRFELLLNIYGSDKNLKIINRVAPNVFIYIHNSLIDSIVISLNRLCDPPEDSRKNKNLSLKRLRLSLPKKRKNNRLLQIELECLEQEIKKQVGKLQKFRHKRIAHNDYDTHTRNWYRSIPNSAINSTIEMMGEYINKIYLHFDNANIDIIKIEYPCGDGPERLMNLLEASLKAKKSIDYKT
jgi:hypothetical protein